MVLVCISGRYGISVREALFFALQVGSIRIHWECEGASRRLLFSFAPKKLSKWVSLIGPLTFGTSKTIVGLEPTWNN
jgi:hypothetical protein